MKRLLQNRLKYNLGRAGAKWIKKEQRKTSSKGVRIRKGVGFSIGRNSVSFFLNQIGSYHNFGVRKHKMKYLQDSKRPIPIKDKATGKIVFRWASKRSMRKRNSWTHPGLEAKKFLEKGVKDVKNEFRGRLKTELSKYLKTVR